MQFTRFPHGDDVQSDVAHAPSEHGGDQPLDSSPARMEDLLAKVPNLALLAAGFLAASPMFSPTVMGGRHNVVA